VTLAPGLLDDRQVAIAGDGPDAGATRDVLHALGAAVHAMPPEVVADEEDAATWARERAPLDALVIDARATFAAGGSEGLRVALEHAWRAARAVATAALIPSAGAGRLLVIAPPPDAGPHAGAARAALENLARTLSVEWARHGVTAVAITPGAGTDNADVAQLVCFLVSPAGGYFSGCRFDLGVVAAAGS
jgi:NAD(P)-dependent dehydrogenase (short-subunit alcohol dehydrogenase family)